MSLENLQNIRTGLVGASLLQPKYIYKDSCHHFMPWDSSGAEDRMELPETEAPRKKERFAVVTLCYRRGL